METSSQHLRKKPSSVVKCKLGDPDGLPGGDKLETLHHARHGLVLQTGILCLRLLLVLDDLRPLLVLDDLLPFLVLDGLLLLLVLVISAPF